METIILLAAEIKTWFEIKGLFDAATVSVMSGISIVGFSHFALTIKNTYYELIS